VLDKGILRSSEAEINRSDRYHCGLYFLFYYFTPYTTFEIINCVISDLYLAIKKKLVHVCGGDIPYCQPLSLYLFSVDPFI
jgi:hypothetical protein